MLSEKNLSECWDTLETIWCGVSLLPSFDSLEKQLDHINNTMSFVNGLLKNIHGVNKEWLPEGPLEWSPDGSSTSDAQITARAAANGRLAHHRCNVDGCP